MIETTYDGSAEGLLDILAAVCGGAPLPERIRRCPSPPPGGREPPELFDSGGVPPQAPAMGTGDGRGPLLLAEEFSALSAGAFDSFLCAWMSELPIEGEIIRFARKVIFAARKAGAAVPGGLKSAEARRAAEKAGTDRGDPDVLTVLGAAYRVRREEERMLGFLRFKAGPGGIHTARCAPDHFVLPRLGRHFTRRFGETPWLIIDEKRRLCLQGSGPGEARLLPLEALAAETASGPGADPWEDLWRAYHQAVNNPSRKNPALQRQFMPLRYRKYLPELL
jgi:probable DNA metabolism protein